MSQRLQALELSGPVLVLAAHPDDEVLGCGGTLAKFAAAGEKVHVAFLADGISARDGSRDAPAELDARRKAALSACQILGATSVDFGDYADNRMDTAALLDVVKTIEGWIEQFRPRVVLTHHSGDVNVDHRRINEAVSAACRPQKGHPVSSLLCFEVPSSTEWQLPGSAQPFMPNWFVDISQTLDRKLAALEAYSMELREWPHPRSLRAVEHLARWRGATVGVEAAEGFVLLRQIS